VKLTICHLYPDLLELYGDRGNILTLVQRLKWRGLEAQVISPSVGDPIPWGEVDVLVMGGGSDREQELIYADLKKRQADLQAAIDDGLVVLLICGGYQLFGQYYQTLEGHKIPGLGILDFYTVAGSKRLVGNIIVQTEEPLSDFYPELKTLVGFENHSGRTYLGSGVNALGRVLTGFGNNGKDGSEGVRHMNVFGTYLHGPVLPKNPHLADALLSRALKRRGQESRLFPLDDALEMMTHQSIVRRFGTK